MRTRISIAAAVLIFIGFSAAIQAQQSSSSPEQFNAMKSNSLARIEARRAKLEEIRVCVEKSKDRSQIEVCLPQLNYGPTEVQASERQMAFWKSSAYEGIKKREANLDEAKACITAAATTGDLKKCQMAFREQSKGGHQGVGH